MSNFGGAKVKNILLLRYWKISGLTGKKFYLNCHCRLKV
jgi:hypothetical protein